MARGGGRLSNSNCVSVENELGYRVDFEYNPDTERIERIEVEGIGTAELTEFRYGGEGWRFEGNDGDIKYFEYEGIRCDEDGAREYGEETFASELGFDYTTFDIEDFHPDNFDGTDTTDQLDNPDNPDNPDNNPDAEKGPDKESDPDKSEPAQEGNDDWEGEEPPDGGDNAEEWDDNDDSDDGDW